MRVSKLWEVCKALDITSDYLEKIELFRRKYPVSLNQPEIYNLITHVINEGSATRGKTPRVAYNNLDLSLHDRVVSLVEALGGRWGRRIGKDNVPETTVDATTARILTKAGLVLGAKTTGQYLQPLPAPIREDGALLRYHLSATFTGEGWPSLELKEGERPHFLVAYSRSVDITDRLPREYRDSMQKGEKLTAGKMPEEIRLIIDEAPFPLLEDEVNILTKVIDEPVRVNFVGLYKSEDEHVTMESRVVLRGSEALQKFREEIGFLPGSEVNRRFEEMWKIYQENKGKKLTREEIEELRKRLAHL